MLVKEAIYNYIYIHIYKLNIQNLFEMSTFTITGAMNCDLWSHKVVTPRATKSIAAHTV